MLDKDSGRPNSQEANVRHAKTLTALGAVLALCAVLDTYAGRHRYLPPPVVPMPTIPWSYLSPELSGVVQTVPGHDWKTVMNDQPIRSVNRTLHKPDVCSISEGGQLKAQGTLYRSSNDHQVLAQYTTPGNVEVGGARCPTGTLVLIDKDRYPHLTAQFNERHQARQSLRAKVDRIIEDSKKQASKKNPTQRVPRGDWIRIVAIEGDKPGDLGPLLNQSSCIMEAGGRIEIIEPEDEKDTLIKFSPPRWSGGGTSCSKIVYGLFQTSRLNDMSLRYYDLVEQERKLQELIRGVRGK